MHDNACKSLTVLLNPPGHRFVLENSGVAEPQNIRDKFADAVATGEISALSSQILTQGWQGWQSALGCCLHGHT